jgi:hypothetical protein
MIAIAKCESGFRQFTSSGKPLYGGLGGQMIGVFQFHTTSHTTRARSLGYDLGMLDGNLAYARYLYNQAGTDPWWERCSLNRPPKLQLITGRLELI